MRIIKIVKKGAKDVVIHFEKDEKLILALEVFLKSGLKKNDEISDDRFSFLIEENKKFHIKQRALRLLGRRQHSVSELKRKLWQKDYDKKLIDQAINDLIKTGYLNDEKFAAAFSEEKLKSKLWSDKKLKTELIKKGISLQIIEEILKKYFSEDLNISSAAVLAEKKYNTLAKRNLPHDEIIKKIFNYLSSKGFSYDVIKTVCDMLNQDEQNRN